MTNSFSPSGVPAAARNNLNVVAVNGWATEGGPPQVDQG